MKIETKLKTYILLQKPSKGILNYTYYYVNIEGCVYLGLQALFMHYTTVHFLLKKWINANFLKLIKLSLKYFQTNSLFFLPLLNNFKGVLKRSSVSLSEEIKNFRKIRIIKDTCT